MAAAVATASVSYRIDRETGRIRTVCAGPVHLGDVVEHFRTLAGDPELPPRLEQGASPVLDHLERAAGPGHDQVLVSIAIEVGRSGRRRGVASQRGEDPPAEEVGLAPVREDRDGAGVRVDDAELIDPVAVEVRPEERDEVIETGIQAHPGDELPASGLDQQQHLGAFVRPPVLGGGRPVGELEADFRLHRVRT